MLTKEQIDIINQSINNIKTLCRSMVACVDCPMNDNCKEQFPYAWRNIDNDKEETT